MAEQAAGDDRRGDILRAAGELLGEGGYAALSIRTLARRAGISLGLLYYYFPDKHAVFEALMQQHQQVMADFLESFPRSEGPEALLRAMLPIAERQWVHVGRLVAVWQVERGTSEAESELRKRRLQRAKAQFDALERALRECAEAEGRTLRPEAEAVPFAWSALMGLADLRTHGWTGPIDQERLVGFTVDAVLRQVLTEPTPS